MNFDLNEKANILADRLDRFKQKFYHSYDRRAGIEPESDWAASHLLARLLVYGDRREMIPFSSLTKLKCDFYAGRLPGNSEEHRERLQSISNGQTGIRIDRLQRTFQIRKVAGCICVPYLPHHALDHTPSDPRAKNTLDENLFLASLQQITSHEDPEIRLSADQLKNITDNHRIAHPRTPTVSDLVAQIVVEQIEESTFVISRENLLSGLWKSLGAQISGHFWGMLIHGGNVHDMFYLLDWLHTVQILDGSLEAHEHMSDGNKQRFLNAAVCLILKERDLRSDYPTEISKYIGREYSDEEFKKHFPGLSISSLTVHQCYRDWKTIEKRLWGKTDDSSRDIFNHLTFCIFLGDDDGHYVLQSFPRVLALFRGVRNRPYLGASLPSRLRIQPRAIARLIATRMTAAAGFGVLLSLNLPDNDSTPGPERLEIKRSLVKDAVALLLFELSIEFANGPDADSDGQKRGTILAEILRVGAVLERQTKHYDRSRPLPIGLQEKQAMCDELFSCIASGIRSQMDSGTFLAWAGERILEKSKCDIPFDSNRNPFCLEELRILFWLLDMSESAPEGSQWRNIETEVRSRIANRFSEGFQYLGDTPWAGDHLLSYDFPWHYIFREGDSLNLLMKSPIARSAETDTTGDGKRVRERRDLQSERIRLIVLLHVHRTIEDSSAAATRRSIEDAVLRILSCNDPDVFHPDYSTGEDTNPARLLAVIMKALNSFTRPLALKAIGLICGQKDAPDRVFSCLQFLELQNLRNRAIESLPSAEEYTAFLDSKYFLPDIENAIINVSHGVYELGTDSGYDLLNTLIEYLHKRSEQFQSEERARAEDLVHNLRLNLAAWRGDAIGVKELGPLKIREGDQQANKRADRTYRFLMGIAEIPSNPSIAENIYLQMVRDEPDSQILHLNLFASRIAHAERESNVAKKRALYASALEKWIGFEEITKEISDYLIQPLLMNKLLCFDHLEQNDDFETALVGTTVQARNSLPIVRLAAQHFTRRKMYSHRDEVLAKALEYHGSLPDDFDSDIDMGIGMVSGSAFEKATKEKSRRSFEEILASSKEELAYAVSKKEDVADFLLEEIVSVAGSFADALNYHVQSFSNDEDKITDLLLLPLKQRLHPFRWNFFPQSRGGLSASGHGKGRGRVGERDVLVEYASTAFALIEALRYEGKNSTNVVNHVKKLVEKYGNFARNYMLVYVVGERAASLDDLWAGYKDSLCDEEDCKYTELIDLTSRVAHDRNLRLALSMHTPDRLGIYHIFVDLRNRDSQ